MRRRRRVDGRPRLEMMPLIDVIFLLLVVFMASLFQMVRAYVLPVELPDVVSGAQADLGPVLVVSVEADGDVVVEGQALATEALLAAVAQRRAAEPDLAVLVNADEAARHGDVVAVYDVLRSAGQARVHLITDLAGSNDAR